MWKNIKPFKVRRFKAETTDGDVELSGECRIVGNTLTVTVTKPFVGLSTQVHLPYCKGRLRIDKARDMALDELELCYLDFTTIANDYDTYKEIVLEQRHYLLELERKRRSLHITAETIKREYMEDKIDSYEYYRSRMAVKNALNTIDFDGKKHYEQMILKHKLTNIGYDYVKHLILWTLHNEEEAKKMIDDHNKEQAMVQAWLDSDSNTTWEEWLNAHPEM